MATHLFIRHGETPYNANPELVGGRSNHLPLTPLGIAQARQFGNYLRDTGNVPVAVYHSGAVRAEQTCQIALGSAGIQLTPIVDERLQELSQGEAEGKPRAHVYTPEVIERFKKEGLDGRHPGGESIRDAQHRMHSALDAAERAYPSGTVLFFGHGFAIRSLAGYLQNLTRPEILALETPNLSETRIEYDSDTGLWRVVYIGKTPARE